MIKHSTGRREWFLMVAFALLAVVPRSFYLFVPFERDEGAYAYVAEIIRGGGLPYVDAFDHKPPLVYYFYALSLKLFGHTVASPRILACLFVAIACLLVALLVYRFTRNLTAALFSCLLLGMSSALPAYTGFSANTEVFVLPFLAGGVLLLAEEHPSRVRFFWAGLLLGTGIMVKQPVAVIALAVLAFHVVAMRRDLLGLLSKMALAACGLLLPLALLSIYYKISGEFDAFWGSVYTYNVNYVSDKAFSISVAHLSMFLGSILLNDSFTWLAAVSGLFLWFKASSNRLHKNFIGLFLTGSVAAISMGGNFYPHYFIFLLPALVTCAGLGAATFMAKARPILVKRGIVLLLCVPLAMHVRFLLMPAKDLLDMCFGDPPFSQSKVVGDYLRERFAPGATAYIIGSEPELYFYSGLKAPSRFFYLYPLVGRTPYNEAARRQVLADLKRSMPDVMIFVNAPLSLGQPFSEDKKKLQELYRVFSSYQLIAMSPLKNIAVITGEGPLTHGLEETAGEGALLVFKRDRDAAATDDLTFGALLELQESH